MSKAKESRKWSREAPRICEITKWRREAHLYFDSLWKSNGMSRDDAYRWLSVHIGIPYDKCHIRFFNIFQCRQVMALVQLKDANANVGMPIGRVIRSKIHDRRISRKNIEADR